MALFPLWSLKKNFLRGRGRADINQQKHTKNIQSLNLIRSHASIMTTVTVTIISLITNIKTAIIIIAITKNDCHNNNNSNNNNNNNNDNNEILIIAIIFKIITTTSIVIIIMIIIIVIIITTM